MVEDPEPKYKARLAAKGFKKQKNGIDFDEIFFPVVKMTTLHLVLGIVGTEDLEEFQNVIRAYCTQKEKSLSLNTYVLYISVTKAKSKVPPNGVKGVEL
ncbi:hypothetical protein L7F22_031046 [Adiantum nelumboides]|nr:hypothetical protein [Adiantum nelumboides]